MIANFGRRVAAFVMLAAVALSGCAGDANGLDGSAGEFYPLSFDHVRARLYSSELSIEFVRESGEVSVRVTVVRREHTPSGPGTYDLSERGDVTGSVEGVTLPEMVSGALTLDAYAPEEGAKVSGSFDAKLAAGHATVSLSGFFEARLDVVDDL